MLPIFVDSEYDWYFMFSLFKFLREKIVPKIRDADLWYYYL